MGEKKKERYYLIAKIITLNLIPVVGILFLNWQIFELALSYLLETFVIFSIFYFDTYFIQKETRYPVPMAAFSMALMFLPFGGIMYAYSILLFTITQPPFEQTGQMIKALYRRFEDFNFVWLLIALFAFESLNYYLNKKKTINKSDSLWFNIRRVLLIHAFIIITAFIYGLLPHNLFSGLFLIVIFKVFLDYIVENESALKVLQKFFFPTKKKKNQRRT